MDLHTKLPDVGVTIFTVMSRLAAEHGAINLSQGFPDFDVNPELFELIGKYLAMGKNQYAPMQGVPELREKISRKSGEIYGARYDPLDEITVTAGATEALFAAVMAVVKRGDEVIIFEPAYDSYTPAIVLAGGTPVPLRMTFPGYSIDWDEVRDAITPRTRMMILNSPHNPTGAILEERDAAALIDIVSGTSIVILSDEVYEHIIYDGARHESMARYPELAARSFVVSSFGKTYHATGWKIGYCCAPRALSAELQKVHQYLTFAVNTPIQYALAEFVDRAGEYMELPRFYQRKRDLYLELMAGSRFRPVQSRGTYFQIMDYSAITDEGDVAFARRLTTEHGVAAIPTSVFYRHGDDHRVLRFCFAKRDETLREAAGLLCRI
ncbi:MAG: methionine aminotransferase [Spirochaetes bacterium]|nr:methionine aminotransferase [Spirochaetota bacterium]